MANSYFRFKQFTIQQDRTAMKVGTDGVLLGAWTDVEGSELILDVGTGTGIIALMLAQRSHAVVDAVEIDDNSAQQAQENMAGSPWGDRLTVYRDSIQDFAKTSPKVYDLIVSNPPYFVNSLKSPQMARTVARHNEQLSQEEIIAVIDMLLSPKGKFAGIFPYVEGNVFVAKAAGSGLYCTRRVLVHGKEGGVVKRLLLQFERKSSVVVESSFAIRKANGDYTSDYINLTKDFYLAF